MTKKEVYEALMDDLLGDGMQYDENYKHPPMSGMEWMEMTREFFKLEKEVMNNPEAAQEEFTTENKALMDWVEEIKIFYDLK